MAFTSRLSDRRAADPDFKPPPGPPITTFEKLIGLAKFLLHVDRVGRNIPLFSDDTLLVSFPRSGNTWIRFLIAGLAFPDRSVTFANTEKVIPDTIVMNRGELMRVPRPRILKSHEYFDPRYPRVIYIVRDPRDVLISYYNFYRRQRYIPDGYPMRRWVEHFLTGDLHPFGSWGEHVGSWLAARGRSPDFVLVRYEDFQSNTSRELARVAKFLGIEASPESLARVIELGSAQRMRSLETQEKRTWVGTRKGRLDIPFVGAAAVGKWKTEIDPSLVARIESAWWPAMQALDYEIVSSPESQTGLALTSAQSALLLSSQAGLRPHQKGEGS